VDTEWGGRQKVICGRSTPFGKSTNLGGTTFLVDRLLLLIARGAVVDSLKEQLRQPGSTVNNSSGQVLSLGKEGGVDWAPKGRFYLEVLLALARPLL
jgi:hypothetical protein